MAVLRSLLCLALIVALLPWGAGRSLAAAVQMPAPGVVAAAEAAPRAAPAAHRCRIALVPGFGCGADPAMLPSSGDSLAGLAQPLSPAGEAPLPKGGLGPDCATPPPRRA